MGRIKCKCGYVIVDVSTHLPYAASILPERSFDIALERTDELLHSLIDATRINQRNEWIESEFGAQYPKDLTDTQIIGDIFHTRLTDISRHVYQCEECGRILISKGNTGRYVSFKPEDEDWKDILNIEF